ncbi:MAG: hypothetical protein IPN94_15555 [Sphingobacteriales bacterium]|nr:hypothetical protein [Sphingobacteriales bacterium]
MLIEQKIKNYRLSLLLLGLQETKINDFVKKAPKNKKKHSKQKIIRTLRANCGLPDNCPYKCR